MKSAFLSSLFLLVALPVFGQKSALAPLAVDSVVRPFDVQSYDVSLDWRSVFENKTHIFSGVNRITLTATAASNELLLDAADMHIDSIFIDRVRLSEDIQPTIDEQLHVPLVLAQGQTYHVDIYYTHNTEANEGLWFFPKHTFDRIDKGDSVFTAEDLAYTMSEPLDAHRWMPCMDRPYDKATSRISIRVPSEYSAQSNGLLDTIDTNSDGSLTFHWVNDTPISTYLMVADASKFVEWTTWYTRVSDTTQKVPIYNYAWPVDYYQTSDSTGAYNAQYALRNTPKMMTAFSERFGEYPFVKYGMVVVQPFNFGGMEHQTLTTIHREWLRGYSDDGIAHELMHQWFGDKTTCRTWADIWLNEGFATYGEAIWEEAISGKSGYDRVIEHQAYNFFNPRPWVPGETNEIAVYDPPIDIVFNLPTTYSKGGCVLHMLRHVLDNDTLFFHTLRDYSAKFAYSTATTADFRNFIRERDASVSPIDLGRFIDEWIYQPGYPIYAITWATRDNGALVIKVEQTQSADLYTMPLRFDAITTDGSHIPVMFVDSLSSQIYTVRLPGKTSTLGFDSSAVIVSMHSQAYDPALEVLGVTQATTAPYSLTRESDGWMLRFNAAVQGDRLTLTDVLGHTVYDTPLTSGTRTMTLPSNRLPRGVFWGRLRNGAKISTFKIEN